MLFILLFLQAVRIKYYHYQLESTFFDKRECNIVTFKRSYICELAPYDMNNNNRGSLDRLLILYLNYVIIVYGHVRALIIKAS
jgi:hypothetical protein